MGDVSGLAFGDLPVIFFKKKFGPLMAVGLAAARQAGLGGHTPLCGLDGHP